MIILPIDVDAASVVALTCETIEEEAVVIVPERVETCEFVLPFTTAAIEDEAV